MRQRSDQQANVLIVYLVVFIILETFIFINLFTAVIVNNLQEQASPPSASPLSVPSVSARVLRSSSCVGWDACRRHRKSRVTLTVGERIK